MDYENLIKKHAFWSDEIKRLKELSSIEVSFCPTLRGEERITCIDSAYQSYKFDLDNGIYHESFNSVYIDMVAAGFICEHCVNLRKLRNERMIAIKKLGQIRGRITMAGRKLNNKDV